MFLISIVFFFILKSLIIKFVLGLLTCWVGPGQAITCETSFNSS